MSIAFGLFIVAFMLSVIVVKTFEIENQKTQAASIIADHLETRSVLPMATGCEWSNEADCQILCESMQYEDIDDAIGVLIEQNAVCTKLGVKLKLGTLIIYPGNSIPKNLFATPIKLKQLHIDCAEVSSIKKDAFISATMAGLQALIIDSPEFRLVAEATFKGLVSLTQLTFLDSRIQTFEPGVFDQVATTLNTLTMVQAEPQSRVLPLTALTGRALMSSLHTARFKYNLRNAINADTFVGVPKLTTLDLSSCKIEIIGANAFDSLQSLSMIRLNDNRLLNLPVGLFDRLLPSALLYVDLSANPWKCDCDVCYVKACLSKGAANFRGDTNVCLVPESVSYLANTTETCSDEKCFEILPTATETSSTTTPSTTTVAPEAINLLHCQVDDSNSVVEIVKLRSRSKVLKIQENPSGSVTLSVNKDSFNNTLLVWFDGRHSQMESPIMEQPFDCRLSGVRNNTLITRSIELDNIKPNTAYTFCLKNHESTEFTVSPFNCVAYGKYEATSSRNVWLTKNTSVFTICMIALGVVLTLLFGMLMGYLLMRRHPTWLRGGKNVVFVRSASDASTTLERKNAKDSECPRRISEVSTISANSYSIGHHYPSRFEIVQRQLELEQRKKIATESQYYMQTIAHPVAVSNLYESSVQSPRDVAPERPTSVFSISEHIEGGDVEPENYYSNIELLYGKKEKH